MQMGGTHLYISCKVGSMQGRSQRSNLPRPVGLCISSTMVSGYRANEEFGFQLFFSCSQGYEGRYKEAGIAWTGVRGEFEGKRKIKFVGLAGTTQREAGPGSTALLR
jgi:hypothetical protein